MALWDVLGFVWQNLCDYTPPIIIHTIFEPSEAGPKEIEVFANVLVEGVYEGWSIFRMNSFSKSAT